MRGRAVIADRTQPRMLEAISADSIWAGEPVSTTSIGSLSTTRRTKPSQPWISWISSRFEAGPRLAAGRTPLRRQAEPALQQLIEQHGATTGCHL